MHVIKPIYILLDICCCFLFIQSIWPSAMTTKKEKLLKKYLDKKKKQRNRDKLYAQIVALNRSCHAEESAGCERKCEKEDEKQEENEATENSDERDVMMNEDDNRVMEEYLWDVHVRNIGETDKEEMKKNEDILVEVSQEDNTEVSNVEICEQDTTHMVSREHETRLFGNRLPDVEKHRKKLPIYYEQSEIIYAARRASMLFIKGSAGCGKTTQVPQFLYEGGIGVHGVIGITQPRRLSAISVSSRINKETNDKLCGYRIKYESTVTSDTKIEVMTDGVLIREIQKDFLLSRYSVIIVDEVHERSVNIDLLISIIPRIMKLRKQRGNELKLVLMSATGEIEEFKEFLGDMDVFECPEQTFPVSVFYEEKTETDYLSSAYARIKKIMLAEVGSGRKRRGGIRGCDGVGSGTCNDKDAAILVFLTSKQDIYQLKSMLDSSGLDISVLPLHSSLSRAEQDLVFDKTDGRKVILSTNIAETSITIPDVVFVIDCGKVKNRVVDQEGLVKYSVDFITKSSAVQRTGRVGRTGPGVCYRLYSGEAYAMFHDCMKPQMLREPLDAVVLTLLSLGITNIYRFPFLCRPETEALDGSIRQLQNLGAIDKEKRLTDVGMMMSKYPIEPRLSRMLCIAGSSEIFLELATIISLIELNFEVRKNQDNLVYFEGSKSDLLVQLSIYNGFLRSRDKRAFCSKMNLSYNTALEMDKMVGHLLKIAKFVPSSKLDLSPTMSSRLRKVIYCGFADHLAIPSSNSHFFRMDEVFPSNNSISVGSDEFVVFESLTSGKNDRLYMRNITVVDKSWF